MRGGGKAVPPPEVALERDEPLPRLQLSDQTRTLRAVDDADLAQPPGKLGRRLDMFGEWLNAFGQRGVGRVDRCTHPAHRRGRIDRSIELVTERSAECFLIAFRHRDA